MISYAKCKELKDNGFPQNPFTANSCRCMDNTIENSGTWVCGCYEQDFLKVPTLSQLIKECGEALGEFVLWKEGKKWEAGYKEFNYEEVYLHPSGKGSSPEEAVANLYLALKKL